MLTRFHGSGISLGGDTMSKKTLIALLTDFGLHDPYVGIMKGVIWRIAPHAGIIDMTHLIRPQNILQASFVLQATYRQFPEGTIFVCVIDPGVGTKRIPVLVRVDGYIFIGPDNGLFGFLKAKTGITIRELNNDRFFKTPVSHTFHGRDIFSPVAAHVAVKGDAIIPDLGPRRPGLLDIEGRFPTISTTTIRGKVMHIDRFGNLITNLHASHLKEFPFEPARTIIRFRDRLIPFVSTFSEASDESPHALIGSTEHLEIFIKNGSAEKTLDADIGDTIHVLKHHD